MYSIFILFGMYILSGSYIGVVESNSNIFKCCPSNFYLFWTQLFLTTSNVKVVGAGNVIDILTLSQCMGVLYKSNISVVELYSKNILIFFECLPVSLATSNVKGFGASSIEVYHSFNIFTMVLIFGMVVLSVSSIRVVESNWNIFSIFYPSNVYLFWTSDQFQR